jgi:hypothetical protein
MSGDEDRSDTAQDGRDDSPGVVRPVAHQGWSGLLDATGRTGERPSSPVVLRPFTGVLGPWQPSIETLTPRLSFLALPWLVREVHTTERERIVSKEPTTGRTLPAEAPPETTTVRRLLRADEGESRDATATPRDERDDTAAARADEVSTEATRTAETLREVLRWCPVLVDRPSPPDRVGDRPDEPGATVGTEPSIVRRDFRASIGVGARVSGSEGGDSGERPGPEVRAGPRSPAADVSRTDTAVRRPGGSRRMPARPPGTGVAAIHRWPTGTARPALRAEGSPTVLRRPWDPIRSGTDAADRRVRARGSTAGVDDVDHPSPDRGSTGPPRLAYRRADGGGTAASSGVPTPPGGTALREPVAGDPTAPGPVNARPLAASTTGGQGDADSTALVGRDAPPQNSTSPFASFPDTDTAIDHVYREIERRWRIDRERRGL